MDQNNINPSRLDSQPIDINNKSDIEYWSKELKASHEQIVEAVKAVGTSTSALRRYFRLNPGNNDGHDL